MPHVESVRSEVQELLRAVPFRPFALVLENGQRVDIEHPENFAHNPSLPEGARGAGRFSVISGDELVVSDFRRVTSVVQSGQDNLAG